MKVTMTRTFRGLEPMDPADLRHVKVGDIVTCDVVKPRSGPRHRWFWACITLVHQNLSEKLAAKYPTPESLVAAMKVLTGWCDTFFLPDGREVIRPRSIAFHKMDELQFGAFCDRCMELVSKYLLPGVNPDDLRREVDAQANERRAA